MVSTIQKELISQKTLKASKTLNHFRTLNSSKALNPLLLELWVFKLFFEYQMAQYTIINDKKILTRLMFSIAILWLIQSNRAKIN